MRVRAKAWHKGYLRLGYLPEPGKLILYQRKIIHPAKKRRLSINDIESMKNISKPISSVFLPEVPL